MIPKSHRLLTAKDVAKILGVTVGTLANWRCKGTGPDWFRVGTWLVVYHYGEVAAFKQRTRRRSIKSRRKSRANSDT